MLQTWLLASDSNIWPARASPGRGGGQLCASVSSLPLFLPSLTLACRHRQTQSGWNIHAPQPYLILKQLTFQKLPCLCPLCAGGGGGLGDGEDKRGAGMTMPGWDSFSISVFLKIEIILSRRRGVCWHGTRIPRWTWVRSKPKRRGGGGARRRVPNQSMTV